MEKKGTFLKRVDIWLFFYCIGRALLAAPSSFHEGSLWKKKWWLEE